MAPSASSLRIAWPAVAVPAAVLLFSLWIAVYSLRSFVTLPEQLDVSQQCRMSRMWPAYIDHTENVKVFSPSGLWRKYRLFLYRERNYDPMDIPTGSPALFVPGNAGSYGQVRSVASSAARQFYEEGGSGKRRDEWKDAPVANAHTDWYTVDFNEDFSAFSGSTLVQQATFLNEVVAYLRDRHASPPTRQYTAGERNTSIPILAHSMGGVSARLMSKLDNYRANSVDTIVTLSTPHAYPPVPFDKSVEWVYSRINEPVKADRAAVPPLIVSIAGGLLDTQLPSDPSSLALARIGEAVPGSRISTFTSSLPSLWSSVDHLAVMWCDQLREKIARGFLLDNMAFGRISEERSAGGISGPASELRKRRELWRRALSLFDATDAGNGDLGPTELISHKSASMYDEDQEPFVVANESPSFSVDKNDAASSSANSSKEIFDVLPDSDGSSSAFEVLTNLCVGWNPSSGMGSPIPQPLELIVMMCSAGPDPGNPTAGRKSVCQAVLPWQWELVPPSLLPRTDLLANEKPAPELLPERRPFPYAQEIYHVPGLAFQLLRLDSTLLKRRRIDYITVERRVEVGIAVHPRGLKSFVRSGWVREAHEPVAYDGRTIVLTHSDRTKAPLSYEWSIKSFGSAILARRILVTPSSCLLENLASYTLLNNDATQHTTDPSFAPFMHISHKATGDSRWYPQIISAQDIQALRTKARSKHVGPTLPLSLHADAPFMPPPRGSIDEVKVQLWVDPALLQPLSGAESDCTSPLVHIQIKVDWRASAGLVVMRYRFLLAAWPLGILIVSLGLSWHAWMTNLDADFPSPLASLLQPQVHIPLIGRSGPLASLWGSLTVGLVVIDHLRLLTYTMLYEATDHAPTSSLLGMILGLHDTKLSLFLIPIFLLISYSVLLVFFAAAHGLITLSALALGRAGIASKARWDAHHQGPPRWKPRSVLGIAGLLFAVVLLVPHQFVFLCMFLLQVVNTLRSRLDTVGSATSRGNYQPMAGQSTRVFGLYHQHLSILLVLLLLLPQRVSFLVTWVRNLAAVGIQTPKTSAAWMDHNVLDIAPILILVWIYAGGRMLERPRTMLERRLIGVGFGGVAWYAFVWGIRYTYRTYDAVNLLSVLLCACHWRSRSFGPASAASGNHRHGSRSPKISDEDRSAIEAAEQFELQENATAVSGNGLPVYHSRLLASLLTEATSTDDLDSLVAQYLDCMDRYQAMRASSTKLFSEGFFQLSKAKIEFGHSRISSNSYDERLLPELRATASSSSSISIERYKPDYAALLSDDEDVIPAASSEETSSGLRRRVAPKRQDTEHSERNPKETTPEKKKQMPDALHQFVALPSPSLRAAQRSLKHAVDEVLGVGQGPGAGLVQIVQELHSIEAQIREMRK